MGLYYILSRYYNPEIGRWVNADVFISTGQGVIGYNMYAYCNNNPVNYVDRNGEQPEVVATWTGTMWWLCGIDGVIPIGDIVYGGGIVILGLVSLGIASEIELPEITIHEEKEVNIVLYKEHTKGARPSTKGKHEKGQTRKKKDNGGEKGDARRYYRGNKNIKRMIFAIILENIHIKS